MLVCRNVAAGQGNFLITKDAPAGEWTDGVWLDDAGFDPSLLYNEGVWYYTRRTLDPRPDGYRGPVVQAILDIATGELGVLHQLTPGYGGYSSDDTERPHLCYVSDWYYPFSADGGPWKSHTQTCSRGRLSWGMFEPAPHNPMITHRHRVGHPIQTLGHADLVDTPDGAWSVLSNGTRNLANGEFVGHHNLGCDTFLIPVDWQDGWPVLGKGGTTELCVDADRDLPSGGAPRRAQHTLWNAGWSCPQPAPETFDATLLERIELQAGDDFCAAGDDSRVGALLPDQTEGEQCFELDLVELDNGVAVGVGIYANGGHDMEALVTERDGIRSIDLHRLVDDLEARDAFQILVEVI